MYIGVIISAVAVLMLLVGMQTRVDKHERRMARLERRIDLIFDHLHIEEFGAAHFQEVRMLVREGRKIEAIKLFRQLTGVGLKEAKDAVESMADGR